LGFSADLPCVIIFSGRVSPAPPQRSTTKIGQFERPEDVFPLGW